MLSTKLMTFVPVFGLAATIAAPVNIDDRPRTLNDWGIPNTKVLTPVLVFDDYSRLKIGRKPITVKSYKVNGFRIGEYVLDKEVYRVTVKRPNSDSEEIYLEVGDGHFERAH